MSLWIETAQPVTCRYDDNGQARMSLWIETA